MNYLKKIGLICAAIVFVMSISVITGYAQQSQNRNWQNRDNYSQNRQDRNRRIQTNRRQQSRNIYGDNRSYQSRNYRYGRITPQEARRLQRQRARLYNQRNRAYRDGYISDRERRRLAKQSYKYRRNVYRDRRDW